jgi:3-oxoacyl-[acyl-carrier protein] reductase
MELGLKDKVALVTAASKGIGYGVAKVLLQEGARVIITSRNMDNLKLAENNLKSDTGHDVRAFQADLTLEDDLVKLNDFVLKEYDGVDILVYNTGPPKVGRFADLNLQDWEYAMKLLLMSAVSLCHKLTPSMITKRWGRLIFITSLTLREPRPNLVLSNTVRLAVAGLMKSLSVELAPYGITSNGIAQGHILTDRTRQTAEYEAKRGGRTIEEVITDTVKQVPAGRLGTPEEIGNLVAFLSSDKAAYVNGTMIGIDGGLVRSIF